MHNLLSPNILSEKVEFNIQIFNLLCMEVINWSTSQEATLHIFCASLTTSLSVCVCIYH